MTYYNTIVVFLNYTFLLKAEREKDMTYQNLESMGFKIKIVENFISNVKHAEINAKTLSRQCGKLSKVTRYELTDVENNIVITSNNRLRFIEAVNDYLESYYKSTH
jgi:hypothetical protein